MCSDQRHFCSTWGNGTYTHRAGVMVHCLARKRKSQPRARNKMADRFVCRDEKQNPAGTHNCACKEGFNQMVLYPTEVTNLLL